MSKKEKLDCKEYENCEGNFKYRDKPKKVHDRLKCGNKRFQADKLEHPNEGKKRRKDTAKNGQKPFAIVLSCADSRVVPELVFDTGLGDLFVIRVAGNIANVSSIASIEYAVAVLGCKYILVLGHEACGAVKEANDVVKTGKPAPSDNLNQLVGHIIPAINNCNCKSSTGKAPSTQDLINANAIHSAKELIRCSTIINEAVTNSGVKIHTGYYHLKSGEVEFDKKSKC